MSAPENRPGPQGAPHEAGLERAVGRKAERRARSRRSGRHTIWFGIGMFGLVGWAVAVPTLAGLAAGIWLDGRFPGGPSWTLTGLIAGVVLGCLNAWWWVQRTGVRDAGNGEGRE